MKRRLFSFGTLLAMLAILATTGCHDTFMGDNRYPNCTDEIVEDDEVDATINLNVPEMLDASVRGAANNTRALTPEDENKAFALDVLVFEAPNGTAEGDETFSYPARVLATPTLVDANSSKYTVRLRLKTRNNPQRLVLIANYPGDIGNIAPGTKKKDVYVAMQKAFTKKWKADGGAGKQQGVDYDLIPMWGESDLQTLTSNTKVLAFSDWKANMPIANTIYLYRSLARVDVGLAFTEGMNDSNVSGETPNKQDPKVKDFELKEVYVYRYNTKYQVPGSIGSFTDKTITSPTLPSSSVLAGVDAPLIYKVDQSGALNRTIYIPENRKPETEKTGKDRDKDLRDHATALVIGGIYKGKQANLDLSQSNKITYYRADFLEGGNTPNPDAEKKYLDILRNHRYRFNITKVGGVGYDTPGEALENNDYAIFYTISVWDNADLTRVLTDGQYMLGVDRDHMVFGSDVAVDIPNAITDFPGGWTATILKDEKTGTIPSWLSLDEKVDGKTSTKCNVKNPKHNNDYYGPLPIRVKEYTKEEIDANKVNGKKTSRTAKILLKAGRLEWTLHVEQRPDIKPVLRILAYEAYRDTAQITKDDSNLDVLNERFNNWTIKRRPRVTGNSYNTYDYDLFTLVDADPRAKEKPRYGTHAVIEFNANQGPEVSDQRAFVLQWSPKEAKIQGGNGAGDPNTRRPVLIINSLAGNNFDWEVYTDVPNLRIPGVAPENIKTLAESGGNGASGKEISSLRGGLFATHYLDQDDFERLHDKKLNTVIFVIKAPGRNGNGNPYESYRSEYEIILDARDNDDPSIKDTSLVPDGFSLYKVSLTLLQTEYSVTPYYTSSDDTPLTKFEKYDRFKNVRGEAFGMLQDAEDATFIMNGEEKEIYVRANTSYRITPLFQVLATKTDSRGNEYEVGTYPPNVERREKLTEEIKRRLALPAEYRRYGENVYKNRGLFINKFYGTTGVDGYSGTTAVTPKYGVYANTGNSNNSYGDIMRFTTVNDLEYNDRVEGRAYFLIESTNPNGKQFRDHVFSVRFVAAKKQPEANSYMMLRGGQGILIPVSRVNTAKKFYNEVILERSDTDNKGYSYGARSGGGFFASKTRFAGLAEGQDFSVEVEWADNETNYEVPVNPDGSALFKELSTVGDGPTGFVYVYPGDKHTGNAMITIKNDRGVILWSWHIWVLEEYPSMISLPLGTANIENDPSAIQQYWMDRNLGATLRLGPDTWGSLDSRLKTYGFLYQHGRKDPFPTVTEEEKHFFSDANGARYDFSSQGSQHKLLDLAQYTKGYAVASIPETIQDPSAPICNEEDWMVERIYAKNLYKNKMGGANPTIRVKGTRAAYFLWGGRVNEAFTNWSTFYNNDPSKVFWKGWRTYKTPFDPCPYGWKVPCYGIESRWGVENSNYNGTIDGLTGFYDAVYNPAGAPGEKTKYTLATSAGGSDAVNKTFPVPGVIYDGGYDVQGTALAPNFGSVLLKYRGQDWAQSISTRENKYDIFRENIDGETGTGGSVRCMYHTSSTCTQAEVATGSGMYMRFAGMNGKYKYVTTIKRGDFSAQYGFAVPIRPVANRITTNGGKADHVTFDIYSFNRIEPVAEKEKINWTFYDESDWTKYLPQRSKKRN